MTWCSRNRQRLRLLVFLVLALPALTMTARTTTVGAAGRPNFVVILTDDQDTASVSYMPRLNDLLIDRGTSFSRFYVNIALCCPSRASLLRGQYSQNTGIERNGQGFDNFHAAGYDKSTLATWLNGAGYRTVLMGKFMNAYPGAVVGDQYIPPGWSEWYARTDTAENDSFNFTLNENGTLVDYGTDPDDYLTDVIARKSDDFIRRAAGGTKPFFMYLNPAAPHRPATPAPRHADLFNDLNAPRTPSFNEEDVSDKPEWVRSRPPIRSRDIDEVDSLYRDRLRSLQAVDDLIQTVVTALKDTGQLDNTYILFSSDNGYKEGQHRFVGGKNSLYEEDIRVPLVVRGPNVLAGRTVSELTGNIDIAPTIAKLAGVRVPSFVDGRSFASILSSNTPPTSWRQAYLVRRASGSPTGTEITGIRRGDHAYFEFDNSGEREYYDLSVDPYQLDNRYASASPRLIDSLATQLSKLRKCAGDTCRSADG